MPLFTYNFFLNFCKKKLLCDTKFLNKQKPLT